jgi:hypothetical protein
MNTEDIKVERIESLKPIKKDGQAQIEHELITYEEDKPGDATAEQ